MYSEHPKKKMKADDIEEYEDEEDYEITAPLEKLLPKYDDKFKENEYVIVAYQDAWYPGCVTNIISDTKATVNFMAPCRKAGTFMWPARKDEQEIEKQFVLRKALLPDCCNSGRQWFFKEFEAIDKLYQTYKEHYF
jgi:single-stranded DNA-specific DHH superfamily exonuclease